MALTPEESGQLWGVIHAGRAASSTFDDKVKLVSALASDLDDLGRALIAVPEPHRVLERLADDPDAVDVLAKRGVHLAAAVGRFAEKKSAASTKAPEPAPPKPERASAPEATATPEAATADSPDIDMKEFARRRAADIAERKKPEPAGKIHDIHNPDMPLSDYFRIRDKQVATQSRSGRRRL